MAKQLRRFTAEGVAAFEDALDRLRVGESVELEVLLADERLAPGWSEIQVEILDFPTRFEAGRYFFELLAYLPQGDADVLRDRGLWTWLAALYLPSLKDALGGAHKLGAASRWVLEVESDRRYYRHFLAGPYSIYRAHADDPERARAILATPVERPGDLVEQIASRQDLVRSASIVEVATRLYYDAEAGTLVRGHTKNGNGGVRRLVDVLAQIDLTWDIYGLPPEKIIALLPDEFDHFLDGSAD